MFQPVKLKELIGASTEAEAAPFTLESLIAWLRTKDASEKYDLGSVSNCLVCQYGFTQGTVGFSRPISKFEAAGWRYEVDNIAHRLPATFGAALSRALAYQARSNALGRAPNSLPYGDL